MAVFGGGERDRTCHGRKQARQKIVPGAEREYESRVSEANVIERAFQLAPECRSIDELRRKLMREGYVNVEAHLQGRHIRSQISPLLRHKPKHPLPSRS